MTSYFLSETHAILPNGHKLEEYSIVEYPDTNCNADHPRGGLTTYVKVAILPLIQSIIKIDVDHVQIKFTNNTLINCIYNPPSNSPYRNPYLIPTLSVIMKNVDDSGIPATCIGDINARFGKFSNIFPRGYTENPDNTINEYGKEITEFIFQQTSCKPINHLCKHKLKGEGGGGDLPSIEET